MHILHARRSTSAMWKALNRKIWATQPPLDSSQPIDQICFALDERIRQHLILQQEEAIAKWKEKVRSWTLSSSRMHAFVKNDLPVQTITLEIAGQHVCHPTKVIGELNAYWGGLETFPRNVIVDSLWRVIEDKYLFFMPVQEFCVSLTPDKLKGAAANLKKTSYGPDSWTVAEVKLLPLAAWESFLRLFHELCASPAPPPSASFLLRSRKTPIPKKEDAKLPSDTRPIDVHSVLVRVVASFLALNLRCWLSNLVHESQMATGSGVLAAAGRLALYTEIALARATGVPCWKNHESYWLGSSHF